MLKFLLIVALVFYAVYKVGSLFFRAGAASQRFRDYNRRNGDIHIDGNDKKKTSGKYKGGEYIDYEEVK